MTDAFEADSIAPTEVSLMVRTATSPDPEYGRIGVLEIMLQNEADDEGVVARLHPNDAVKLQSFVSNIEQKLDAEELPNFDDYDAPGP